MKIRAFKPSDARTIFELRTENTIKFYPPDFGPDEVYYATIAFMPEDLVRESKERDFYVGELKGEIIGFFSIEFDKKNKNEGMIKFLHVRPEKHRQGYGTQFIDFIMNWLKERNPKATTLKVITGNPTHSGDFYSAVGFKKVGEVNHYYKDKKVLLDVL